MDMHLAVILADDNVPVALDEDLALDAVVNGGFAPNILAGFVLGVQSKLSSPTDGAVRVE